MIAAGRRVLSPVLPRENYREGLPLVTPAVREQLLRQRAVLGQPAALVPDQAMQALPRGREAPTGPGRVEQYRRQMREEYRTATPARRAELEADPNARAVLLGELLEQQRQRGRR